MKRALQILDIAAFAFFGIILALAAAIALSVLSLFKRRRREPGEVNELSFAVFDLISNKYSSMLEDALLNGYIANHHYIYLDFNHRHDRFEKIGDNIFFYSIAAHPGNALYNAGFYKTSMLLTELKALTRAFNIAKNGNISFVKAHDPHLLGFNGLLVARWFRLPCVLHMNSDFSMKYRGTGKTASSIFLSRGLEKLFESAMIGSYDLIMADRKFYSMSSSFPRRSLKKYRAFGVRVDRSHYSDPASRRDLRGILGLGDKKVLLYVGRLHPVKYPDDAIKAFSLIKKEIGEAVLLMAGSGILEDSLKDMAAREGLGESVRFLGPKRYEELIDLLYTADLLLAPHGGVTLVEAALASTPIVAYDFDWHSECLEDSRMGYLVPFRDVERMAEKAVRILKDGALRGEMGGYCRMAAMARYLRETSMKCEKEVYNDLLSA
jgi:glycosyltransferase involved in cell wall biosynthesis